jgi:hypothetical protein
MNPVEDPVGVFVIFFGVAMGVFLLMWFVGSRKGAK